MVYCGFSPHEDANRRDTMEGSSFSTFYLGVAILCCLGIAICFAVLWMYKNIIETKRMLQKREPDLNILRLNTLFYALLTVFLIFIGGYFAAIEGYFAAMVMGFLTLYTFYVMVYIRHKAKKEVSEI